MNAVMYSSATDEWSTPDDFFKKLNDEFHFTLDPCATKANAKCAHFFDKEADGLNQDWGGETVFCNPPYGRQATGKWLKKCYQESQKPGTVVVALVPARTDTKAFHDYVLGKAEMRFVRGRLKFGGSQNSAPFPSVVLIYERKGEN